MVKGKEKKPNISENKNASQKVARIQEYFQKEKERNPSERGWERVVVVTKRKQTALQDLSNRNRERGKSIIFCSMLSNDSKKKIHGQGGDVVLFWESPSGNDVKEKMLGKGVLGLAKRGLGFADVGKIGGKVGGVVQLGQRRNKVGRKRRF